MKTKPPAGRGEKKKQAASKAAELISPLTTPIKVLPITMEKRLIGDIKHSSKHRKKSLSTCSFIPAALKLVVIAVRAIIPGTTNKR